MHTLVGRELQSTYRLDEVIGRGGSGVVYASSHLRLSRQFAIKVLAPGITEHGAFARLRREAEITSRIAHPHIVEVIDFNHMPDGSPYFVMELLQGEDLARWLSHSEPSLDEVGSILRQAAAALHAAHAHGVVHRDLKPRNIFLCQRGKRSDFVKVMDFGISKVLDSQSLSTTNQKIIGTARYMAPEQADGRPQDIDERTDIFAMGLILYEMLAGQPAFTGRSPPAVLYQIVHGQPKPLRELRPDLPSSFQRVIDRALHKEPSRRHRSMEALWQAFVDAMDFTPGPSAFTEDRTFDSLLKGAGKKKAATRRAGTDSGEVTIPSIEATVRGAPRERRDTIKDDELPAGLPGTVVDHGVNGGAGGDRVSDSMVTSVRRMPSSMVGKTASDRPPFNSTIEVRARLGNARRRQLALAGFITAALITLTVLALYPRHPTHPSPSTPTAAPRGGNRSRPLVAQAPDLASGAPMTAAKPPPADAGDAADARRPAARDASVAPVQVSLKEAPVVSRHPPRKVRRRRKTARPPRSSKKHVRPRPPPLMAPTQQPGTLIVQSTRQRDGGVVWANVYLDGKKVGQTALILKVAPGPHRVSLRRAGYGTLTKLVRVRSGERQKVRFVLEQEQDQ